MAEAKYCVVCGGKYKSNGKCPEGFYPGSFERHQEEHNARGDEGPRGLAAQPHYPKGA